MKKKIIIGLTILIVALLITSVVINLSSSKNKKTISPVVSQKISAVPNKPALSGKSKEYLDPSGFKFSYPDNLKLEKKLTDQSGIAQLNIISDNTVGKISIKVTESDSKTTEDWLLKNKKEIANQPVKNIKLGPLDAKQYLVNNELNTIAVDQGGLFQIKTDLAKNEDFWRKVNQAIISSFTYVETAQDSNTSSPGSDNSGDGSVIDEGEEIVE